MEESERRIRIELVKFVLKMLEEFRDDARYESAKAEYERQLGVLENPPAVVVNLQPGSLTGKSR